MTANGQSRLRRALAFAFPFRYAVGVIFIITLCIAAANAAEPVVLFKYIFDSLVLHGSNHVLVVGICILIGLGIFREAATAISNWLTWHARLGIHYSLLEVTVERLHRMPLGFHREQGVGAVMTKLDRGIQGFITGVTQILFNIFPAVLYLVISIAIMFRLNWQLTVIVMCFVPVPAIIAGMAGPEQTRRERNLLEQCSKIYSRFKELLPGIWTLRIFSMKMPRKQDF